MRIKQSNIIWSGTLYHSIENCILTETNAGNEITSTIVGDYKNKIYKVEYHIKTTINWETIFVVIRTQLDNSHQSLSLEKKNGKWLIDHKQNDEFNDIFDIDISLTPFTNTLPINRLQLKDNECRIIDVIYFDILERKIRPVKQIYTKISTDQFIFENYDKSFKAEIRIDKQGLVVEYPKLFEMTTEHESHYP